ncbi:MAG: integrase [Methanobrevibacter sp.]|nr:integrase [Methanobrevibacter sp.]
MYSNRLFKKFCRDRNIKSGTQKGYGSALRMYENFQGESIENLFKEARFEENERIPLKNRKIKQRLVDYRSFLLNSNLSPNTSRTYFSKIKTFYLHFDFELPNLPQAKYDKIYETNYLDLPTREHIHEALLVSSIDLKAVILFMSSSGTAKAETLSLTVEHFIRATWDYHHGGSVEEILETLDNLKGVVPTFYLKRIKTDKYYYTFCSPEASSHIVKYLKTRKNLKAEDKLFDFSSSMLLVRFQEINDKMGWGFKGRYRFFRTHALRKFHASNIGLSAEYIDSLQGRSKNEVHEAYIKTNPEKLKEIYKSAMKNVMIHENEKNEIKQEFTIVVNIFLSGKEYNII